MHSRLPTSIWWVHHSHTCHLLFEFIRAFPEKKGTGVAQITQQRAFFPSKKAPENEGLKFSSIHSEDSVFFFHLPLVSKNGFIYLGVHEKNQCCNSYHC